MGKGIRQKGVNPAVGQQGSVVTLILGILLMVGTLANVAISTSGDINSTLKDYRISSARQTLASHLNAYASIGSTFRSSLSPSLPYGTNQALYNCIIGGGSSSCMAGGIEHPVTLYYPTISTSGTFQILAGAGPADANGGRPARYDVTGAPCAETVSVATVACPFEVFATFVATCAGGARSCAAAESIAVRYVVRISPSLLSLEGSKDLPILAPIDQVAPSIARNRILPSSVESASSNVMVSVLTVTTPVTVSTTGTTGTTTVQTQPVAPAPVPDPAIVAAIQSGGVKKQSVINTMAIALASAGFTDPAFITAVTKAGLTQWSGSSSKYTKIISALGAAGITDVKSASLVVAAGITLPDWARLVADSNVSNAVLAGQLQGSTKIKSPAVLASVVSVIEKLPQNTVTLEIGKAGITDSEVVNKMWSALSTVDNKDVAIQIVKTGVTDPAQITAIAAAVSGVQVPNVALALAKAKVTDPAVANNLAKIVSVIKNPADAAAIIPKGIKDASLAQKLVNEYLVKEAQAAALAANPPPKPSPTPVATTTNQPGSPSSSSTTGSSQQSSSGTSANPGLAQTATNPTLEIQLLAPCAGNQCGIPMF